MDLSNYRALVVDDSEDMISVIQTGLKSLGMKDSICLTNPGLVMDALAAHEPDIVITDWVMEPTDGLELSKIIRAPNSPNRYIPIIILTAYAEAWRISAARDAGINEFLAKPISINGLKERVAQTLLRPRPFIDCENYFGPCRRRKVRPFVGDERRQLNLEPETTVAVPTEVVAPQTSDDDYTFPDITPSSDFVDDNVPAEVRERLKALQDSYPAVLSGQVSALKGFFPALIGTKQQQDDAVEGMRHISHDIMGQAATFGYPLAGAIALSLNKFLHKDVDLDTWRDLIETHTNAIMLVGRARLSGDGGPEGQKLVNSLVMAVNKKLKQAKSAA
ncbi:response regulator [Rhodovibrionaceae bacterium A322]